MALLWFDVVEWWLFGSTFSSWSQFLVPCAALGAVATVVAWWLWTPEDRRYRAQLGTSSGAFFAESLTVGLPWWIACLVFERGEKVLRLGLSRTSAFWFAAGLAVCWLLCSWIAAERDQAASGATWFRPLARLAVTLPMVHLMALNRHLLDGPTDPATLVSVLATSLLIAGLVLWLGRFRPRLTGGLATVGAGVLLVSTLLGVWQRSSDDELSVIEGPAEVTSGSSLLLITLDTLRKDVFDSVVQTTSEGRRFLEVLGPAIWFEQTIAVAPWTAPSVASIHTGRYPIEHGVGVSVRGERFAAPRRLSSKVTTLAETLRSAGMLTAAVVNNPFLRPGIGLERGFERYQWLGGGYSVLPAGATLERLGLSHPRAYADAETVLGTARQRLPDLLAADRWFLWLHFMDPHGPLTPHPDLEEDVTGLSRRGRAGIKADEGLYRQEVRYLLSRLTSWFEDLQTAGLWRETTVALISDHGEMFLSDEHEGPHRGRQIREGHGHALFEELVHVPFVLRPPSISGSERVRQLVSHVDVGPLLLRLMSGAGSEVSLPPHDTVLAGEVRSGDPRYALRTAEWKLLHSPFGDRPDALYRLSTDPGERADLSSEEPQQAARLLELLQSELSRLEPARTDEATAGSERLRRQLEALGYLQ